MAQPRRLNLLRSVAPKPARIALLLLLAVVGAGCSLIYYQAPQGAPTAVLTVVNQSMVGDVAPRLYEKADCSDGGRALGYDTVPMGGSRTFNIEANKPAPLVVSGFKTAEAEDRVAEVPSNGCEAFISFVPEAGRKYAVMFAGDERGCALGVSDVSGYGARAYAEVQRRRWLTRGDYDKAGGRGRPRCPIVAAGRPQ